MTNTKRTIFKPFLKQSLAYFNKRLLSRGKNTMQWIVVLSWLSFLFFFFLTGDCVAFMMSCGSLTDCGNVTLACVDLLSCTVWSMESLPMRDASANIKELLWGLLWQAYGRISRSLDGLIVSRARFVDDIVCLFLTWLTYRLQSVRVSCNWRWYSTNTLLKGAFWRQRGKMYSQCSFRNLMMPANNVNEFLYKIAVTAIIAVISVFLYWRVHSQTIKFKAGMGKRSNANWHTV